MSFVLLFVLLEKGPSIYHQDLRLVGLSWLCALGHKPYLQALTPCPVFFAYFCVPVVAPDCITGFCKLPFFFWSIAAWFDSSGAACIVKVLPYTT